MVLFGLVGWREETVILPRVYSLEIITFIMKRHKTMREVRVVPRAVVPLTNGEAARCGEAVEALNVRHSERSLQVTGMPARAGSIAAGERLLLVTAGHRVTCSGLVVKVDGQTVATLEGPVINAHVVGGLLVIVGERGMTYLAERDGVWVVLDPAAAVPAMTFTATPVTTSTDIDAYAFAEPYSAWRAPLASADRTALWSMLHGAWSGLVSDATAEGLYSAPMLVRWAVRLVDDSYLWMSDPVRVGDATLANADRIAAPVTTGGGRFTGIEATTLTLAHYRLDLAVTRDIDPTWLPLVKSIDVLATSPAQLLTSSRALDYRCVTRTTGGREYVLEMGLSRRSATAIASQLASSSWQLIVSAPARAHVVADDFAPPLLPLAMTNGECAAVGALSQVDGIVCSASAGGRLYCCTAGGDVIVSVPGNALVEAHRRTVLGAVPVAMAVVSRPLYSGGFGRYPVYVFTGDGIHAIPQSATGTLGEARLVDRTVIAPDVAPVEGGGSVWLMSRHGHLCRLAAARVDVCLRDVDCVSMAWCNAHGELWLQPREGLPNVLMEGGWLSRRSVDAAQLYSDPQCALAVSPTGDLLDLEREEPAVMAVSWRTHPIALDVLLGRAVLRVVWHVVSDNASLELRVTGQRGIMAQDRTVSVMTVAGAIDQPLAAAPVAVRSRTVRLSMTGTAISGTLLLTQSMAW